MDGVIVMKVVAQVVFQLGEEAGGYEGAGCSVYARFALLREMFSQKLSAQSGGTFVGY